METWSNEATGLRTWRIFAFLQFSFAAFFHFLSCLSSFGYRKFVAQISLSQLMIGNWTHSPHCPQALKLVSSLGAYVFVVYLSIVQYSYFYATGIDPIVENDINHTIYSLSDFFTTPEPGGGGAENTALTPAKKASRTYWQTSTSAHAIRHMSFGKNQYTHLIKRAPLIIPLHKQKRIYKRN